MVLTTKTRLNPGFFLVETFQNKTQVLTNPASKNKKINKTLPDNNLAAILFSLICVGCCRFLPPETGTRVPVVESNVVTEPLSSCGCRRLGLSGGRSPFSKMLPECRRLSAEIRSRNECRTSDGTRDIFGDFRSRRVTCSLFPAPPVNFGNEKSGRNCIQFSTLRLFIALSVVPFSQ